MAPRRPLWQGMAYMDWIPCASLSQRSRILMNSASALICDLSRVGKGDAGLKSEELKLVPSASRWTDTAGLCPAPRPILG